MRFLMTTKGTDANPDAAMMAEMGAFIEEMTRAGVLLATGGLEPGGVRMISSGGEITVTDGPFTEAKEAIVSFALIEARSREEAVELARRFWKIVGDGEGSIQQVFGPEDAPGPGPR
ncbi:YciI family protein [Microbispora sp. NPDC046973]|uniref:YciI family protein n=1 Tax=Microbispora sp. NPDC046973 TaxID=3155022 RepID=UPI0033E3B29C